MKAYVLAAGLGTRLAPLTHEVPKPLVEVLGTPLLHYALDHARRAGATRVVVNTHWLADVLEGQGPNVAGLDVVYSREAGEIQGTGGGVKRMAVLDPPGDGEPFLLLNADALIDLDTAGLVAAHAARKPTATLVLKRTPDQAKYGLIGTDDDERVRAFAGRVPYEGPPLFERMFCGVHLATAAVLARLPDGPSDINKVAYPPMITAGADVRGFDHRGYFCDVGTPERLLEANLLLLSGRERLAHADPFARFGGEAAARRYVHKTAHVDGATLLAPVLVDEGAVIEPGAVVGPYAVVGKRARVAAGARLSRAVVMAGALVAAGDSDGIIGGVRCRIDVDPSAVAPFA